MHPAKSVIFFTTATGAGYGLIVWLAVSALFGLTPPDRAFGLVAFGLSITLIVGGLLSSTFHLGHPERAWRALSQWRSSWLSREGVAAVLAFGPIGLFAMFWVVLGKNTGLSSLFGLLAAISAISTVYCTAMIYASLKSIPAWKNPWTPVSYIILSLMTGGVLAAFLASLWGFDGAPALRTGAIVFLIAGTVTKLAYWHSSRNTPAVSSSGTATGLGQFGTVSLVDAPHTESNYLLEEMGFQIARNHADKLRKIAFLAAFVLPLLLIIGAIIAPSAAIKTAFLAVAVISCGIGIVTERWLFFAEAKHVVTLYYGEKEI
ncbi:MAG: dimethyl sulfoxide reductase anchor subunit family protein [Parvularcula sp.]